MILTAIVTKQDSLDTKICYMPSTLVADLEYCKQSHEQEGHGPY